MRATLVLVLVNVAVYVAMIVVGGFGGVTGFHPDFLRQAGGNLGSDVMNGEVWRLFTSTLIHINIGHILMNMIALVQVGRLVEKCGGTWLVGIYVATGLIGSVASTLFYSHYKPNVVSAGASGAICGLIGAGVILAGAQGGAEGKRLRMAMLRWGLTVIVIGAFIGADNAAHIGGFISGLLCGVVVAKVNSDTSVGADIAAIVVFLLLTAGAFGLQLSQSRTARIYELGS